jgi:hypothetical protein
MITIGGFLLAFALLIAVEWAARRPGSRIPTLGEVCTWAVEYEVARVPVGRIGVVTLWWWVGWHFLAR